MYSHGEILFMIDWYEFCNKLLNLLIMLSSLPYFPSGAQSPRPI